MSTCESTKLESKTSYALSALPAILRPSSNAPTLCSSDPTKFVYDSAVMPVDFNIESDYYKSSFFNDLVKNLNEAQKNFDQAKYDSEDCYTKNQFHSNNCYQILSDAEAKLKAVKAAYDVVVSAIQPLPIDTGNPKSHYNYDCRGADVFRCTTCMLGFGGENCDKCAKGFGNLDGSGDCHYCNDDYCSGHGKTCILLNGIPTCQKCDTGFTGADCGTAIAKQCPATKAGPCNSQGTCTDGLCSCNPGFTGTDCGTAIAKQCPATKAGPCNGQGTCTDGLCSCNPGFTGADCGTAVASGCKKAPGDPVDCSGNGTCVANACNCASGQKGAYCEIIDPGMNCPRSNKSISEWMKPCSGNGVCVAGKCQCNLGFGGDSCSDPAIFWKILLIVLCAIAGLGLFWLYWRDTSPRPLS